MCTARTRIHAPAAPAGAGSQCCTTCGPPGTPDCTNRHTRPVSMLTDSTTLTNIFNSHRCRTTRTINQNTHNQHGCSRTPHEIPQTTTTPVPKQPHKKCGSRTHNNDICAPNSYNNSNNEQHQQQCCCSIMLQPHAHDGPTTAAAAAATMQPRRAHTRLLNGFATPRARSASCPIARVTMAPRTAYSA